ncbi:MAG: RNase adapter RapZ [Gammaproteobacteria bacterium]|nr:RNase adapter RapZ [Gammaproteobacteria bacterium]NND40386.1 RNase adapter RapZ [Pseudomonadales bacterium]MBT8149841.1 RNase adapter RapZ [Gammaproteobacteria bacterium]NNL11541.1 RNase adapter RapZ [Pseudomonadales bacterium]NNM12551.1 RNase adapter RapZ [Pseudomonadales bacterium]
MQLTIISGRSGSGKSTALNLLEDIGYYCVDNLPVGLIPALASHAQARYESDGSTEKFKIAIGIDARNIGTDLSRFPTLLEKIPEDIAVTIVFLDANDDTLIKRFSETRRKHPLSSEKVSLPKALSIESDHLESIAAMSDLSVDTTSLNQHQLRELIKRRVGSHKGEGLALMFQSFGFKRSIPIDSDIVYDARCLPNPYWQMALRDLTGKDIAIQQFLEAHENVQRMVADIQTYLDNWLPCYQSDNRSYLTVSIGCTGGRHRSVYIVEKLYTRFKKSHGNVQLHHRELDRAEAPH